MANDKNLKGVYETLKKEGYTPPAFDEFVKDMQDDKNLRGVHSTLTKSGYTPPSYEQFKIDMLGKAQASDNGQERGAGSSGLKEGGTSGLSPQHGVEGKGAAGVPGGTGRYYGGIRGGKTAGAGTSAPGAERKPQAASALTEEGKRSDTGEGKRTWNPSLQDRIRMQHELNFGRDEAVEDGKDENGETKYKFRHTPGVMEFNERSRKRVEQARRVAERNTPQGRRRLKAGRFQAQLAGTPTSLLGLTPGTTPGMQPLYQEDGQQEQREPLLSGQGPVPHGVKIVNGERKTEWLLPDGSLTTDMGEADAAEYGARTVRLRNRFVGRMRENGLDPAKREDVEKQAQLDYEAPIRKAVAAAVQADDERSDKEREGYMGEPLNMVGGVNAALGHAAARKDAGLGDLTRIAEDAFNSLPSAYRRDLVASYTDYFTRHPEYTNGKTIEQAASDAAKSVVYGQVHEEYVRRNGPQSGSEFFVRKMVELNPASVALSGTINPYGQASAELDAMERYGAEHRGLDIAGMVAGMGIDPTAYFGGWVGNIAFRHATRAVGKVMARRALGDVAGRYAATSLAGRMFGSVAAGGANLGLFEMGKDAERQLYQGGYVDDEDLTSGSRPQHGISLESVFNSGVHGLGMGAATGVVSPLIGNVADKLVKATSSTGGKVALRAGETAVSKLFEGTVFAAHDIYAIQSMPDEEFDRLYAEKYGYDTIGDEQKRAEARKEAKNDMSGDAWSESLAMMMGFGVSHAIKTAPGVIRSLRPVKPRGERPLSREERMHNNRSFSELVRERLDHSPSDLAITREEREELKRKGYGRLADLFGKDHKSIKEVNADGTENYIGDLESGIYLDNSGLVKHGEIAGGKDFEPTSGEFDGYEAMERLMGDESVSEATRAKAYYILTGRNLPPSTVTGWSREDNEDGTIVVYSHNQEGGIITSRSFSGEKGAEMEIERIKRQVELNTIDVGEKYRNAEAEFYGRESARPEVIREMIKEETGVDVDKAIRKEPAKRSEAEREAVKRYVSELFPEPEAYEPTPEEAEADRVYEEGRLLYGRFEQGEPEAQAEVDAISLRMTEAYELCEEAFGDEAEVYMAAINEDPWGIVTDPELTAERKKAVLYYINAKAALDGVLDASNEAAADRRQRVEEEVGRRTHKERGVIVPATMKVDDREVYIVKGEVAMFADGSGVDVRNSSDDVIILDESGEYRFASPDQILRVGEAIDPQTELQGAFEAIDREQEGFVSGIMGGEGEGEDSSALRPQHGVEGKGGEGENDGLAPDTAGELPESVSNVQEYDRGYEEGIQLATTLDDNILNDAIEAIRSFNFISDEWRGRLEAYEYEQQRRAMEAQSIPENEESVPNPGENVVSEGEVVPEAVSNEPQEGTALSRIPLHEETGEPMFESVEKELAWDGLVEAVGTDKDAADIAFAQIEQANEDLEALKKKPPTMKAPKLKGSPMAMAKAKKDAQSKYEKELADYNQRLADTQEKANAWTAILGVHRDRTAELRRQQEEERRERDAALHDQAVAQFEEEMRLKAERDAEQERIGIHAVNPKIKEKWDAANKVEGNADVVMLADGSAIRGRYVLTEAGTASASHDVNNAYEPTDGFPIDENGESVNDRDYLRDKDAQRIVEQIAGSYDSRALQTPVIVSKDGVVLSGNNRTMGGDLAARQGTDRAYTDYLREFGGKYGFTREQVEGMEHPRIVFVPDEDMSYDAVTFARFNAQEMKSQSKPEEAVRLGKLVSDKVFSELVGDISRYDRLSDYYRDEEAIAHALGVLMQAGVINDKQLPRLRTGNALSAEGRELLENVLIGKAFQTSADAVHQLIANPSMCQSVVMGLGEIAFNRRLSGRGYDLIEELSGAIDLVSRAKSSNPEAYKEGMAVSPFGMLNGLFDELYGDSRVTDAATLLLADILNSGKPSELRKVLAVYNESAGKAAGGAVDLFSDSGRPETKEEILTRVNELFRDGTAKEKRELVESAIEDRKERVSAGAGERRGGEAVEQVEDTGRRGGGGEERAGGEVAEISKTNKRAAVNPVDMPENEKERRGELLRNATAIEVKRGQIVATKDLSARKAAELWWDENVGEPALYDTEVGEVEINRNSVESSLAHKYGQMKLDAITSLTDGFENAVYLGTMADFIRQEGVSNHFFAYPIMYDGKRCYVFCRAMQDANKNRLYVHEVFEEDKIKKGDTLQTAASQPHGGIALYRDILANVLETEVHSRPALGSSKDTDTTEVISGHSEGATAPAGNSSMSSGGKGNALPSDKQGDGAESSAPYTITPTEYQGKKKKTPVWVVKFERELSYEEKRALVAYMKEPLAEGKKTSRGWLDKESGDFYMRSEEGAKGLVSLLGDEEAVADAQPLTADDYRGALEESRGRSDTVGPGRKPQAAVNRVSVEDLMTDLSERGETRLSDHAEPVEKERETQYEISDDEMNSLADELRDLLGIGEEEGDGSIRFRDPGELTPQERQRIQAAGVRLAMGMIERGVTKFPDLATKMVAMLGDKIRPWLKSFYDGARWIPGYDKYEFTPSEEVAKFDVQNFDKPTYDPVKDAEMIVEERKAQTAAEQAEKELKENRNKQRKENDRQREADTEAIAKQGEVIAGEAEATAESAGDEREISGAEGKVDEALDRINKQLSILRYFKDEGKIAKAEIKAAKAGADLAARLMDELELKLTDLPKDVDVVSVDFGEKGGYVRINLPVRNGYEPLRIDIRFDRTDDGSLQLTELMTTLKRGDSLSYIIGEDHQVWLTAPTYKELIGTVREQMDKYLPKEEPESDSDESVNGYKRGDEVLWDRYGNGKWEKVTIEDFDADGSPIFESVKGIMSEKGDWSRVRPADGVFGEAKRVATKAQAERKKKEKPVVKGWTLKPTSILSTNGSGAKVQFSVENAKSNLLKVSSDWKDVIHAKGFIATLTRALGSPDGLHAQSFYYTLARGNDEILTLRLSNHNVNAANHDGKTPEISIVIKSRRQPNRFYPSSGADVREYVYFKEDIAKGDGNTLSLIAKDLADLLDTGQYRDSSGLALVNVSPADRPADALSPEDGLLPGDKPADAGKGAIERAIEVLGGGRKKQAAKKKQEVKSEQPVGDLFGGLFDDEPEKQKTNEQRDGDKASQGVAGGERAYSVGVDEVGTDGRVPSAGAGPTGKGGAADEKGAGVERGADGAPHGTDAERELQSRFGDRGRDEGDAVGGSAGVAMERGGTAGEGAVSKRGADRGGEGVSPRGAAAMAGGGGGPAALDEGRKRPVRETDASAQAPAQKPAKKSAPRFVRNFRHDEKEGNEADAYTPSQRLEGNVKAIETLAEVLLGNTAATDEQREIMSRFRGWGQVDLGKYYDIDHILRATFSSNPLNRLARAIRKLDPQGDKKLFEAIKRASLSSYYTPTPIARAMNTFLGLAGFKGGAFLDPSMGNGMYEGTLPKSIQERTAITGVELDWLSGQLSRQLYPDANVIIGGFEKSGIAPGSFDVVTSNVPFGDIVVNDPSWKNDATPVKRSAQNRIHNYYAVKMLEAARPGGLVAMLTTSAVMDTPSNQNIRAHIAEQGEILGAIRLPDNTFQGTGVVTDILFIRKWRDDQDRTRTREDAGYRELEQAFLSHFEKTAPNKLDDKEEKVQLNGYFEKNPRNLIGEVRAGNQYGKRDAFALTSKLSVEEIASEIEKAIKRIVGSRRGSLFNPTRTIRETHQAVREAYKGEGDWVSNGNLVIQEGKVGILTAKRNEYGEVTRMFEASKSSGKKELKRAESMIGVRTAMKKLIAGQIEGANEEKLMSLRTELQEAYDNFVGKYGRLQDKGNSFILDDIDGYTLQALERWKNGKFEGLSDIFTKNSIKPALKLDGKKRPQEAVALSLAEYGYLRADYLAKALGEDWAEQCGDFVFLKPNSEDDYVTRDEYLSGDVVTKLAEARAAAEKDKSFERHVKALEEVQPERIPFDDITIHLGGRWIPESILNDFVNELFGIRAVRSSRNGRWDPEKREYVYNQKSGVRYIPETDSFEINIEKKELGGEAQDWETPRKSAKEILQAALEDKTLLIKRKDKDGNEHIDEEQTELANQKIADLRERFEIWLPGDPARVDLLEQIYNDRFNRTVKRHFDGSHLVVPGLMGKELRPHQKDAVWMLINNRGGIVDHIVGAGKTLVMQSAIMEMRRMGIAKKPMIVALKSTVSQIAREFKEAFPSARVLAPNDSDFKKENRKKFIANISLNDYDCVILSHEQYCMLPHTEEAERAVIDEQLWQLDNMIEYLYGTNDTSQMTKKQIKALEKRRNNLTAALEKRLDRNVDREFCFENLGVDYLFVDESHQFKSLPYVTSYQKVAGLGDTDGSNKAVALLTGIRHLQRIHQGDKGTVFLSGTTITNSLVEIYNLLNYLRPRKLEELGMTTFDAWASTFAVHSAELEAGVTGSFAMKDRFRSFDNVPELSHLYAEIADVRNDTNLKLPKPAVDGRTVIVPASKSMQEINAEIVKMLESKDGSYFGIHPNNPQKYPWGLRASTLSANAAVSPRLIFPDMEDDGGKIHAVCENVKSYYDEMSEHKGVQLIFCELGVPGKDKKYDAYTDIINRLSNDYGIPKEEIAYIQQAPTDEKRKELFQRVRDGKVRIFIGGTTNMGTGVNVQDRITDVHMLTVPWTPSALEQGIGRAARQGNLVARDFMGNKVRVHYYATEGSLDLYKYQLLDAKGKMFTQFKMETVNGGRSFDEGAADEDGNIDPAEVVAILSGNPVIFERAKQEKVVKKLRALRNGFERDYQRKKAKYTELRAREERLMRLVRLNERDRADLAREGFKANAKGVYPATVTIMEGYSRYGGRTFDKPKEAGEYLLKLLEEGKEVTLQGFGQRAKVVTVNEEGLGGLFSSHRELQIGDGERDLKYTVRLSDDATAAGTAFRNLLKRIIDNGEVFRRDLDETKRQLAGMNIGDGIFPKQAELDAAVAKFKELNAEYNKLGKKPDAKDGNKYRLVGEGESLLEAERLVMADRVEELADKLNTPVRIITNETELQVVSEDGKPRYSRRERRAKGWWSNRSGEVVVVLPNNVNVADVENTVVHEVVGHKGLRAFIGEERFAEFLDEVYGHASDSIRKRIDALTDRMIAEEVEKRIQEELKGTPFMDAGPIREALKTVAEREAEKRREEFRREATEEYMADLGGRIGDEGFEKMSREELTLWGRIKAKVQGFLDKFLRGLKIAKSIRLTDKDLSYILFKTWKMAREGKSSLRSGQHDGGIFAEAEDAIRRYNSGWDDLMSVSEKRRRIEKLRKSEPVRISGEEFEYSPDLKQFKKNAVEYGKTIQGEYVNKDNGKTIQLQRGRRNGGLKEVLQHDMHDKAHIQSVAAIPGIIENSIYIETAPNHDKEKNPDVTGYEHYVCGLKIGGEDYTVHSIVAADKNGNRYYDHKLSHIEKGKLLDFIEAKQPVEEFLTPMSGTEPTNRSERKVKELISLLQIDDEGAIKRFRDGDLGLEEAITKMKVEAAAANGADFKAKQAAMRAIGGNLSKLRQAMARQREYDITTVKSMTDLAKIMMDSGLLDNWSNYDVNRVLSTVKNAVGKQDTSKQVQNLMDIMVDNQLRWGENYFGKLLSVKGSRVDARGIEVQGALDADGQKIAQVVRKAKRRTLDDIETMIAEAINRMSSTDQVVAEEAALEYAGLQIAGQYAEEIRQSKEEERDLRDSIREAESELKLGHIDKSAFRQFVRATEEAIRQNKVERAEAYWSLCEQLGGVLGESVERAKAWREAEKQRVEEIHHNANSDMEGRRARLYKKDGTKDDLLNIAADTLLSPLRTFEQMLKMFGSNSSRGEGYLYQRFIRQLMDALDNEWRGYSEAIAQLDEKVSQVFGEKMKWTDLYKIEKKLPKGKVKVWDDGEYVDIELKQGNLLYVYMVDKMTDGRMKLRRMGITEEAVERIKDFVDPRFIELADWIQEEFLVNKRNKYNEVYKRMFGTSMAAIENYFPIRVLKTALENKPEEEKHRGQTTVSAETTGAWKKRTRNNKPLDIMNANVISLIVEHLKEMEHAHSFSELSRDLNTLRKYKKFEARVRNMRSVYGAGNKLWNHFEECCSMATGDYKPPTSEFDRASMGFAKWVTAAKIAFRFFTAFKQFASFPAFLADCRLDDFSFTAFNLKGSWKWAMENLPNFEKRWKSRIAGDPILKRMENERGGSWKAAKEWLGRWGMASNAFVDGLTVAIGARAMYKTKVRKYRRWGLPEEEVQKRAKQDAELLFNLSQQSSESAFLSTIQSSGTFWSAMWTVFRNASMSYSRQVYDACRNLGHRFKAGYKEQSIEFMRKQMVRSGVAENIAEVEARREYRTGWARDVARVAIYAYVLPAIWYLFAKMPFLLLGNDEEKKKDMVKDALVHGAFGTVEGFAGGDLISDGLNMLMNGEMNLNGLEKNMPIVEDIRSTFRVFKTDEIAALNDLINIGVQVGLGVNPQTLEDMVVAALDFVENGDWNNVREYTFLIARIMNCPQSQLDEIYFDEIGMSGEEIAKIPRDKIPEVVAERYAEYNLRRNAALTGWAYSEEERKEAMDKQRKKAKNAMKERMNARVANERTRELLEGFEEVSKREKELNRLKKSDREAYRRGRKELREGTDMRRHNRVKRYNHDIKRLTEKWMNAKTPQEADSIARAMLNARERMLAEVDSIEAQ